MKNLAIRRTVEARFDVYDWQLYTSQPDADWAATELNHCLEVAVSADLGRDHVREAMWKRMVELSKFGAADTEPRCLLEDVLDAVYGEDV